MLNPNQSKNFKPDYSAMMENDPFASIVECCHITHSAEEILGTCGFSNERVGPEDDSEELTQHDVPPIMMFSLSDTQSQGAEDSESSSSVAFSTAVETVLPISSDAGQSVPCNASKGADPDKAVDLGRDKDSSVPKDHETTPEVVSEREDASSESETETENYRFVKRGAASDSLEKSELRGGSSGPSVVRGPCKVQNVQDSAIEDDSKKAKFDVLNVLKEIVEHQKIRSTIPKRNAGLTFPRPRWWPENYEDMV